MVDALKTLPREIFQTMNRRDAILCLSLQNHHDIAGRILSSRFSLNYLVYGDDTDLGRDLKLDSNQILTISSVLVAYARYCGFRPEQYSCP